MSRIGKLPITIPQNVKVSINGATVSVEGPKGKLEKVLSTSVTIVNDGQAVQVSPRDSSKLAKAMHGTARAIIQNMVTGVVDGYKKQLEIQGTGFKAILKGNIVDLALGHSHPDIFEIPAGITITVVDGTKITIEGVDRQMVGESAACIKRFYPVEPYKGKGVREVGQFVRRKEGKKTA
ncbi:MAG: 50S ribosomal protein L6 [Verrucomicrobia bacterium 21-51-4]|nr:MAG: 50S ribosomal protein L6 [Verrucomicrobia bacterium 21-51-4]HQU08840.1 50S ribosomal protein L6 [Opitutales bacterium]